MRKGKVEERAVNGEWGEVLACGGRKLRSALEDLQDYRLRHGRGPGQVK
jgi:hypothetical protein